MLIASDPVNAFVDYPDVPVPNAAGGPLHGVTLRGQGHLRRRRIRDGVRQCREDGRRTRRPEANAPCVQRLLDAGAKFVGKTHTAELAFSLDGRNSRLGTPKNPAAPGRVPGGSSSGSAAAVAAGLVDTALGSDTGGSVRGPASMCGIIGLRPTHGRIDISGAMPLAPSLDTVGWFTRDIGLYERIGAVLLGEDRDGPPLAPHDPGRRCLRGADVAGGGRGACAGRRRMPGRRRPRPGSVTVAPEGSTHGCRCSARRRATRRGRRTGRGSSTRKPELMPAVAARFEAARQVTEAEYRTRRRSARAIRGAGRPGSLGDDGVILLPTLPTIAPKTGRRRGGVRGVPGARPLDPLHRRACRRCRRSRCRWRRSTAARSGCR